ncbi:MAG: polysaccharide export protein, partial [Pedobacter sp.]
GITVASLNEKASAIFNMGNSVSAQNNPTGGTTNAGVGFIVDQSGEIQVPYLGTLKVRGLSTREARELVRTKLLADTFLKEPVVTVRLLNFKISVLGDVARPGTYPIQGERVTIAEALGMAGDLTITAQRNNVLLVRESEGMRKEVRLNLQSKELLNSPYYYLQSNDLLYVQPGAAKYASVDSSYRNVSIILSALSVIALLISRF